VPKDGKADAASQILFNQVLFNVPFKVRFNANGHRPDRL
jgi:hypothetical protein